MSSKYRFTKLALILLCISILATLGFAVKNFTVDPVSVDVTKNYDETTSQDITLTNTGNESLNFSFSDLDLSSSGNTLTLDAPDSVLVLNDGANSVVSFQYRTNVPAGNYTGTLTISNVGLDVQRTVSFKIEVLPAPPEFEVTPLVISKSVNYNTSNTETITINYNGNGGAIDLNFVSFQIQNSNNDKITLTPQSSSTNLNKGESFSLKYDYTSLAPKGNYLGTITIRDSANTYTQNVNFNIEVLDQENSLYNIGIVDFNNYVKFNGEIDEDIDVDVTIKNTGTKKLNNVKFDIDDLDGDDDDKIDDSDVDFDTRDGFDLDPGEEKKIKFEIEIPNNIVVDTYIGNIKFKADEIDDWIEYEVRVEVTGGNEEVEIKDNTEDVRSGEIEILTEAGESESDYKFTVDNDGNADVENLKFELKEDLKAEFSNAVISKSNIEFSPSSVSVDADDDKDVEIRVRIPEDTKAGTYTGKIYMYDNNGDKLDSVNLKIKVTGDIYISDVSFDKKSIEPDENLKLTLKVKNKGNTLQRNVKVYATIFDVDRINSNLESDLDSNSFAIDANTEITKDIYFKIPDDATDGTKSVEIRLVYSDNEVTEIESIAVERPAHSMRIENSYVQPKIIKCKNKIYSYVKARNDGSVEEDVKFITEIVGQNIKTESGVQEISTDESYENSLYLNIEHLKAGNYQVKNTIKFGSLSEVFTTNIVVQECSADNVIIDNGDDQNSTGFNRTDRVDQNNIEVFGKNMNRTTFFLGTGLVSLIVLILVFAVLVKL